MRYQIKVASTAKQEKTVTSNTRISNVEKFNLELILNLVGVGVGWGGDLGVCVEG